jgi:hypothetical protein
VLQALLKQFPAQINRENILKNREFKTKNREISQALPDAGSLRHFGVNRRPTWTLAKPL